MLPMTRTQRTISLLATLTLVTLPGCDADGGDTRSSRTLELDDDDGDFEDGFEDDEDEEDEQEERAADAEFGARREIPAEAAASMKAATDASLAPQFHACPYYLTYEPSGFDEFGNDVGGWIGAQGEAFLVDRPSWFTLGGSVIILCGTTQSPHTTWMNVRRNLGSAVTGCVTSPIGSPNAWFVCS